jgi:hypothetical protein
MCAIEELLETQHRRKQFRLVAAVRGFASRDMHVTRELSPQYGSAPWVSALEVFSGVPIFFFHQWISDQPLLREIQDPHGLRAQPHLEDLLSLGHGADAAARERCLLRDLHLPRSRHEHVPVLRLRRIDGLHAGCGDAHARICDRLLGCRRTALLATQASAFASHPWQPRPLSWNVN